MKAGTLNNKITLQQLGTTQDALGQPVNTWTDVVALWANVKYERGLEYLKAGTEVSLSRCSIRIRYRAGVTAGMRVKLGIDIFNIMAVQPDMGRHEFIDLVCEAVNAQS